MHLTSQNQLNCVSVAIDAIDIVAVATCPRFTRVLAVALGPSRRTITSPPDNITPGTQHSGGMCANFSINLSANLPL